MRCKKSVFPVKYRESRFYIWRLSKSGYETEPQKKRVTNPNIKPKMNPVVKWTAKDSVFTNLFKEPKYLLRLYQALHPEDKKVTEKDLMDVTINNVLTNGQYNDLGFRVRDRLLILIEAQSKWSENIIIRILLYLMQTYNQYFTDTKADLYNNTKIKLPKPELYVIYTGDENHTEDYITLKDEFFGGQDADVDARVRVITSSVSGDIINQYIEFTNVLNDQVKKSGRTREAIEETIRICKDKDVLKEYLETREKEVIDIMTALYDEQEVVDRHIASIARESEIKGLIEAFQLMGKNESETSDAVVVKYGVLDTEAKDKVKLYWK